MAKRGMCPIRRICGGQRNAWLTAILCAIILTTATLAHAQAPAFLVKDINGLPGVAAATPHGLTQSAV